MLAAGLVVTKEAVLGRVLDNRHGQDSVSGGVRRSPHGGKLQGVEGHPSVAVGDLQQHLLGLRLQLDAQVLKAAVGVGQRSSHDSAYFFLVQGFESIDPSTREQG